MRARVEQLTSWDGANHYLEPSFVGHECIQGYNNLRNLCSIKKWLMFLKLFLSRFFTFSKKKYSDWWPDVNLVQRVVIFSRKSSVLFSVFIFAFDATTYIFSFELIIQYSSKLPLNYSIRGSNCSRGWFGLNNSSMLDPTVVFHCNCFSVVIWVHFVVVGCAFFALPPDFSYFICQHIIR